MAINPQAITPPALLGDNGPIYKTGCGDSNLIVIRTYAGSPGLALTLCTSHGQVDGRILIEHCSMLNVWVRFVANTITSINFYPEFTDEVGADAGTWYRVSAYDDAATGIMTLKDLEFSFTAAISNFIFQVPNPGAKYARIYYDAAGVDSVTDYLGISVSRGWGDMLKVIV